MIIKLENEKERTELEVLIRYNEKLHRVKKIEEMLRSVDCKIPCNKEKKEIWVAGAGRNCTKLPYASFGATSLIDATNDVILSYFSASAYVSWKEGICT